MAGKDWFAPWLRGAALTVAVGGVMAMATGPAHAATSLRKAAASAAKSADTVSPDPGSVLYGYYDFAESTSDNGTGNGQNVMRLINSTGKDMCALIYVFDDDEELGECCGCPLTANQLESFGIGGPSVAAAVANPQIPIPSRLTNNLTANWREASGDQESGVVAVVGATAFIPCTNNGSGSNNSTPNPACNGGCDPTIHFATGVLLQSTPSGQGLNGNIVHNQAIGSVHGLLEVDMFDDSPGDSANTASLQDLCRNNIQNGSGRGWCSCPTEFNDGPTAPF